MAIKDQLLRPKNGMKRIDDRDINIKYIDIIGKNNSNAADYYCGTYVSSSEIEFYIYSSKIILTTVLNYENRLNKIDVYIDDVLINTVSQYNSTKIIHGCYFEKLDMEKAIHKIRLIKNSAETSSYGIIFDAIDIDEDGCLLSEEEYIEGKIKTKFPVMIGDSTITSETNIANYASTLTNGERQLLIMESGKMFLTDGNGSYIKINNMGDLSNYVTQDQIKDIKDAVNHDNRDVLDLLSTNGNDLFFNGKNVQKVELENGQYGYTTTIMNALTDNIYTINIDKGSKMCDQIVQAWEFTEGGQDITTIAKTFNNAEKSNFYYDSEFVEFNENECKIKDKYKLDNTLNSDTGLYETKLNISDFIELVKFGSEVN